MTSFRYRQCRTKRPWLCLCAGEVQVKSEGVEEDSLEADPMEKDEPGRFDQAIEDMTARLQGLEIQTHALAVQARLRACCSQHGATFCVCTASTQAPIPCAT